MAFSRPPTTTRQQAILVRLVFAWRAVTEGDLAFARAELRSALDILDGEEETVADLGVERKKRGR